MRNLHSGLSAIIISATTVAFKFRLFLKGLGLSMEDCLTYFSREFCKKGMTRRKFYKDYAYRIRHSYGKGGKRADYTLQLREDYPGTLSGDGEYHGCPFKSFDVPTMRRHLAKKRDISPTISMQSVSQWRPRILAWHVPRRHFETLHPGADCDGVGNHPNAWYEASVAHTKAMAEHNQNSMPMSNGASAMAAKSQPPAPTAAN